MKTSRKIRMTSFQIISLCFLALILIGTFFLMLPFSSKSHQWTPFIDALFTSASAVCVTGLVVYDTATHWTIFGQIIILLLIQIGGMGVITLLSLLFILSGKKIGLFARRTVTDAVTSHSLGGILRYVGFIGKGIFLVEFIGALIMMPTFISRYGAEGIWLSFFHSISAFCNAGFDLMGSKTGEFSSLTSFMSNPIIVFTICALVIIGGIGFVVWSDVIEFKFKIRKYKLQSKICLLASAILILIPMVCFFFFEFNELSFFDRLLASLFQSITPRTAGFNTIDLNTISESGLGMTIILMLIGGAPGSTAGGMKVTTIVVICATVISLLRKKEEPEIFNRRFNNIAVKSSISLLLIYLTLFSISGFIISRIENINLFACLFETASALGTVGLSLGITSKLHIISKLILIFLMYFGRVGGLTILFATLGAKKNAISKYPSESVTIG